MRLRLLTLCALTALTAACATPEDAPPPVASMPMAPPPPRLVGDDGNAAADGPQSCKMSAGYVWCDSSRRCERTWELAREKGFPNTLEGFQSFCKPVPK
jgi:hypothetical protein